ncbi:nucleoside-diphosphate kinase [Gulosibacter chungangensis]|uniref:Nucleoside diphosphate kinase n=1 Tax=Gulosibacter chungangensis TaxID=979746 RepID=A0A7J5B973_9MICO|nr:nucleoside-diphosphate kinase [Gulosibacter chungangensis]KAB1641938.1 nucleoside-diphosphate kinase [Gulosibacter chungangensis]
MSSQQEQTLVLVKPDGVRRNLIGEVLARIERKGYVVTGLKLVEAERELLEKHYEEHVGKPFFEPLLEFMMSGPIVAARVEGHGVVEGFRSLAGATNPTTAAPGTIRGDLGRDWGAKVIENIVHGSDSVDSAERELAIWFG